jgi:hypothetical protein
LLLIRLNISPWARCSDKPVYYTLSQTVILMGTTHTFKPVFVIAPHLSPYRQYNRSKLKSLLMSSSASQASTLYSPTPTHNSHMSISEHEGLLDGPITTPQAPPNRSTDSPLPSSSPVPSTASSTNSIPIASPGGYGIYQQLPSSSPRPSNRSHRNGNF